MFARDIWKMASFYANLFLLEEICESRSPIFRGLRTGKANLGFNAHDAYTLLKLQNSAGGSGVKAFASFNVDEATEVDRLTPIAIAKGAVLRSSRQLVPDQFGPA